MADKYDEDADTCQARAHSRMQNSVSSELSASITAVSYTHLDVYKRQVLNSVTFG